MLGFSLLMVLQVFILISLSMPIFIVLIVPTVLFYLLILVRNFFYFFKILPTSLNGYPERIVSYNEMSIK